MYGRDLLGTAREPHLNQMVAENCKVSWLRARISNNNLFVTATSHVHGFGGC